MNTAARMNRLFSGLLLLGLCVGVIADEYKYERTKNIVYKEIDGESLKLDVYIPEDEGPFPACLLYTSPSPRDGLLSRMPSSA